MNKSLFLTKHNLFIIYLVLSQIGVEITKYYPAQSHYYWFLMMFVFGGLSIASQYHSLHSQLNIQKLTLIEQSLHWFGGLFVAVIVNFYYHSGRIFTEETGLIMLLTLALTTYLEGSNRGWRYCFTGVFLGLVSVSAAYFDNYVWQFGVIAAVGGVISHTLGGSKQTLSSMV